ncbi:uncharacterized protein LOC132208083 isoform X2 [Stegostoma tigrinum]|uniref:uncharacterized protein LOC132208083 isoform X2 n=1 Tax=Stegostoma tigrinum TaxID=3053191 RepID=UPI0028707C13|nr:uncharacterized protein LOC132208083 isoform X2 [Stegostoma tigrinum]
MMALLGITQMGYMDPFRARVLQPDPGRESSGGEEIARDECQTRSEPVVHLPSEDSSPFFRTKEQCLEERYFGRLPADCETGAQLERMPYHNGSVETYSHMKLLCQTPKAPNMMYRVPLTDSQQIGWWLPQDPSETLEKTEPWSRVIRYPLANSEMTQ